MIQLFLFCALLISAAFSELVNANSPTTLVICDIDGLLFSTPTAPTKVAPVYQKNLITILENHHKKGDPILYVATTPTPLIFWQKSLQYAKLPLNPTFSLGNEIFMGFNGLQPSCKQGIILCQGHSFGAVLSIAINQLWIRSQLHPTNIMYYTANSSHVEQLKVIAARIGTSITVQQMEGTPYLANKKKQQAELLKETKQPVEQKTLIMKPKITVVSEISTKRSSSDDHLIRKKKRKAKVVVQHSIPDYL